MADPYSTKERSAWVLARAGRNADARRRGELLAARARRIERDEAGAGDAPVAEVVTRNRWSRRMHKHDEDRFKWALVYGSWETMRALAAGPGLALGLGLYLALVRMVPRWGPPQWRRLAIGAAVLVPLALIVVGAILWFGDPVPFAAKYVALQVAIAAARLPWLVRAWGWEAVRPTGGTSSTGTAGSAAPAPIVVRVPEPESPSPAPNVVVMRRRVPPASAPVAPPNPPTVTVTVKKQSDNNENRET